MSNAEIQMPNQAQNQNVKKKRDESQGKIEAETEK
jgi:hypothetical protein